MKGVTSQKNTGRQHKIMKCWKPTEERKIRDKQQEQDSTDHAVSEAHRTTGRGPSEGGRTAGLALAARRLAGEPRGAAGSTEAAEAEAVAHIEHPGWAVVA